METLNQLAAIMNKEDLRHYKLVTSKVSSSQNRKDWTLLNYIRASGEKYDDEKIFGVLYSNKDKNSFYRLKNRLIADIGENLLLLNYQKDELLNLLQLISQSRLYFQRSAFALSYKFLKKAENLALKTESFELLEYIYGEYIRLSNEIDEINPEEYIERRKSNSERITTIRQIDDVLAAVRHRLKVTQNLSGKRQTSVLQLLEKTIADFSSLKVVQSSSKFRFKLYSAVSQFLLQTHDYIELEKYVAKIFAEFSSDNLFDKNNHDTKLQMLTFGVNSAFKNGNHKQSLEYASLLNTAMDEFSSMLRDKYLFFYYNSLVINYSVLDKDKAIGLLEELKGNRKLKSSSFYELFIYLNLSVLFFEKKSYRDSIKNLTKLFIHDSYKKADESLKFKIATAELIIRFELGDFDVLEKSLERYLKQFGSLLNKTEGEREKQLVGFIKRMMNEGYKRDRKLIETVKKFISNSSLDDSEIIKYNAYLKGKLFD